MAYDEALAEKLEKILEKEKGITKKKMFGGLCFLLNGNMCCGVIKDRLVLRVGPENYESALQDKNARPMDFTGKPLRGFIYVIPSGLKDKKSLEKWVQTGIDFASCLPKKQPKIKKPPK